ncbi:MAG: ABC transporter substrate-binding protein [Acidimicrobiaceae bacterium]|nr:ABC transporter substrate-binding protein [Acidimicrobiaceae bacterium]MCY3643826.1 ABC transporter substrate-binding protein [Acidimicrobiaceae bacterium]MDE0494706.1 ABC transporter substrate-binding protein [Acidimicrobiaceae bacterium]MXW89893.1 ABC transporter substrate-binding protein [Acidimicrobiaceae bacterium]MXY10222.1 ABC transporter substrate-binding protein [Acidimicrobiaceae bacterium]
MKFWRVIAALAVVTLVASACGDDEEAAPDTSAADAALAQAQADATAAQAEADAAAAEADAAAAAAAEAQAALEAAMAEAEGAVDPEVVAELEAALEAAQADADAARAEAEAAAAAAEEAAAAAEAPEEEPAAPVEEGPSGTLRVAVDRDVENLDPNFAKQIIAETFSQAVFDSLITFSYEGDFIPLLASEFAFTSDTTLEFWLREGITFHNGETFDARSVTTSVARMQDEDEGSHLIRNFASIVEVEVVNDYHVIMHLSGPDAQLLHALTRLPMVPPDHYAAVGQAEFAQNPIGSGPFKFVEYVIDSHTIFEANPDYWDGSPKGKPLVAEVVMRVIPEPTTRVSELVTGGVDLIAAVPLDQRSVVTDAGMTNISYADGRVAVARINSSNIGVSAEAAEGEAARGFEALTDVRVRQALNYAVDRQTIIDALLGGTATPLGQPFVPGGFGYNPDNEAYPYDPDRARELLAEAGYGDGLNIKLTAQNTILSDVLTALVDYFADVGVTAELEVIEPGLGNQRLLAGDYDPLFMSTWYPAETFFHFLIRCEGLISTYCNPDLEPLLLEEKQTLDIGERNQIIWQITDVLREEAPALWLWNSESTAGVNTNKVSGWKSHARGWIMFTDVSVSE